MSDAPAPVDDAQEPTNEHQAAEAAIESVKALHCEWKRYETDPSPGYCAHCEKDGDLIPWPCPTMIALGQAERAAGGSSG
ncbi:hypothetical protein [Streptomyces sp. NPDC056192]|uniref:hypothetical protein n=1 Tax=Streptomyces sp. NPDC056192 TaxID=3345743 RepID=UPI0035DC16A2